MRLQPLAKVHQAGRMEAGIARLPVQGEVSTDVVVQHLHRLPIRQPVQLLQNTHAQHQHRLNGHATIVGSDGFGGGGGSSVATARSFRPPAQAVGNAASLTQNEKIAAEVFQQNQY
jgi:hypothetical protein